MKPTEKTIEAEKWVDDYINKHGYPPTYEELAEGLKISKTSAYARARVFRDKMTTASTINWEPSLRDYFAAKAMQSLIMKFPDTTFSSDWIENSYRIADAMLEERKKR